MGYRSDREVPTTSCEKCASKEYEQPKQFQKETGENK